MRNGRYAQVRQDLAQYQADAESAGLADKAAALGKIDSLFVELVDELRGYAAPAFWQGRVENGHLYTEAVRDRGRAARAYIRSLGLGAPEPGERQAGASSHE